MNKEFLKKEEEFFDLDLNDLPDKIREKLIDISIKENISLEILIKNILTHYLNILEIRENLNIESRR